jgi:hypothetical protein
VIDDDDDDDVQISPEEIARMAASMGISVEEYEVYTRYKSMKGEALKDYLRWNKQVLKGVKDELVMKCTDGEVRGALGRCPICENKLALALDVDPNGKCVKCGGGWDEELQQRIQCDYITDRDRAPRLAWRTTKPTEEEEVEAMRPKLSTSIVKNQSDMLSEYDLTSRDGRRDAAKVLITVCRGAGVKLPDDDSLAMQQIGPILISNQDIARTDVNKLIEVIAESFGIVEVVMHSDSPNKKPRSIATVPENEGLVLIFKELSKLYREEGNRNAGNTYGKVTAALASFESPIKSSNQFNERKGGVKVPGIGPTTIKYIDEYLKTGMVSKLEEKRKVHGVGTPECSQAEVK